MVTEIPPAISNLILTEPALVKVRALKFAVPWSVVSAALVPTPHAPPWRLSRCLPPIPLVALAWTGALRPAPALLAGLRVQVGLLTSVAIRRGAKT